MIVTVGDASPRQARGHIGDSCVKWEHFLNDVSDQTGAVWGRIKRVEMSLMSGFHMIITVRLGNTEADLLVPLLKTANG